MKNKRKAVVLLILCIIIFSILYNIYNNSRINIIKQEIVIDDLPESFDGFTILQISDLHEKRFGKNQKRLLGKINKSNYDMIAITGDMQSMNSNDITPLLELLDGIKNKEYMFYVSGNHGPIFSSELKDRGAISLEKPYEIKKGQDTMMVYDFYDGVKFKDDAKNFDSDLVIGITHYPWHEKFYSTAIDTIGKYDLVLSGHYHGGQFRVPFYGALFIPDINGEGFFPKQSDVSGLNNYGGYNQYISRGLGASSDSIISRFRLFNTPEINLITLINK